MKIKVTLGKKITICILILQMVVMLFLSGFVVYTVTNDLKITTINSMKTIVEERSQIVENYVKEAEKTLMAYSRAGEILDIMLNPTDTDCVNKAQAYTEKFSADVENLEGLYASEWNTHVLTHTNAEVRGIVTREGESLKVLQDAMLAADGVYNTGIIISPASGQQIVSMYMAVYDETNTPVGLVGGGIFSKGLIEILDKLTLNGMQNAEYCMVDVKSGQYIFNADSEKIGQAAEEEYIINICNTLSGTKENLSDYVEYKVGGTEYISTYHYMADHGWLFMVADDKGEVFASANELQKKMIFFCINALILMIIISYVIISKMTKPMKYIEKSIRELQNFDVSDKNEIKKYSNRSDELGTIAKATEILVTVLQEIIGTLKECCNTLESKATYLHESATELVEDVTDNVATTEELSASLESTNIVVTNVNQEIININSVVDAILNNITDSVEMSDSVIGSAHEMQQKADCAYKNGQDTLVKTKHSVEDAISSLNSLSKINELAEEILSIAGQTNLLSLNASIEAARAGEAGRGFAVVAEQIGNLADTSKNTAADIQSMCSDANESINVVNECFESIIQFMEDEVVNQFKDFAENATGYSMSAAKIKSQLDDVNEAVVKLEEYVNQISNNISDVNCITDENRAAIGVIVEKNENTSQVAGEIQEQSEQNKVLATQLDALLGKFTK
ncbi:MAG: methyl-accepting chemotaxis protein [Lachnospiraceae bacterium]|nr:methyl-accepting chemotaxis protein [Lachnospiraceae bacterium]